MELYKPEQGKNVEFTVGADIEYFVFNAFKVVDPKILMFEVGNYGSTGFDGISGESMIHEIRPCPSHNPLAISHNIKQIFNKQIEKFPQILDYTLKAGAYHKLNGNERCIGAHLHYGLSKELRAKADINFHENLAVILDNYLGIFSIILEDFEQGLKRRKIGYGLTGRNEWTDNPHGDDKKKEPWRKQPHGGEYRVCSSFLVSPAIIDAFYCLFKVIVFEYLNNKNFQFRDLDLSDDFQNMRVSELRAMTPEIWCDIQKMQLYPKFKCYIDLIYTLVSKRLGWTPRNLGVKEAWGLIKMRQEQIKKESEIFKPVSMSSIWGDEFTIKLDKKIVKPNLPPKLQKPKKISKNAIWKPYYNNYYDDQY